MKEYPPLENRGNNQAFVADDTLLAALRAHAHQHTCSGQEALFCQGEPPEAIYLLRQGQVTLTTRTGGHSRVFAQQTLPGSIFGLPGVIGDTPYSLTATAEDGTRLDVISRAAFHRLLHEHPEMSFHALRILAAEVQAARKILNSNGAKTPRARRSNVDNETR